MKIKIIEPGTGGDLIMLLEVGLEHAKKLREIDADEHDVIAAGLILKKSIDMWLGLIPVEEVEVPN